jgi:8-oxo-dGTP pyrophosphatase MutT (NUDIX family)
VAKRSDDRAFYPGVWDVPGGHCNENEAPAATLVRELHEELGIAAQVFEEVAVLGEPRPAEHGEARYHMFVVRGWKGDPQVQGSEHSELRWVSLDEARSLPLAHPEYLQLFRVALA